MVSAFIQIVAAYYVADLLAAMYHYATDKGWNPSKRITAQFQKHHDDPSTMTFDLEPMIGGVPIVFIGSHFGSPFIAALGVFVMFAQVPHYYVHHEAPPIVRTLQRLRIILAPADHASHHGGAFDRNYSVINGWANPLVNRIVGVK